VAVKVAKEKHDMRFDIPCLGAATIQVCHEARISALGFEGGKTLLLDREELEALIKKHKITLAAL
jgi:hypothetical protein